MASLEVLTLLPPKGRSEYGVVVHLSAAMSLQGTLPSGFQPDVKGLSGESSLSPRAGMTVAMVSGTQRKRLDKHEEDIWNRSRCNLVAGLDSSLDALVASLVVAVAFHRSSRGGCNSVGVGVACLVEVGCRELLERS